MPTWARFRGVLEHADNSTFAKAKTYGSLQNFLSQDEHIGPGTIIEAATTGITFELGNFTTINGMMIENLSTTSGEDVDVEWYCPRGSQTDTVTFAQAATGDTITDDSSAGTMVTNGSRAGSYVRITAAATAANNATWLIRSSTINVVTLVTESTLTADGADAVVLYFEDRCTQQINAATTGTQSILFIGGPVTPEQDLLLTSASGTPACRITVFGT